MRKHCTQSRYIARKRVCGNLSMLRARGGTHSSLPGKVVMTATVIPMPKKKSFTIKLAEGLSFDLNSKDVIGDGLRVWTGGESGSGKTTAIALFVGQWMEQGGQVVVLDPHNEFGSLGVLDLNAKLIGYGNVERGLSLADDDATIRRYVQLVDAGKSLLINLKTWVDTNPAALDGFVLRLMRALYELRKTKPRRMLVVVDEAHSFMPEVPAAGQTVNVRMFIGMLTGGRKYGLNFLLGVQRQAIVDKTVLASCNVRIFLRVSFFDDWEVIKKYMPYVTATRDGKPYRRRMVEFEEMKKFQSGEAVVLARWTPDMRVRLDMPSVPPSSSVPAFLL